MHCLQLRIHCLLDLSIPSRAWLLIADVYPLIAAVLTSLSFAVYFGSKHLLHNPEVNIDPRKRSTAIWERPGVQDEENFGSQLTSWGAQRVNVAAEGSDKAEKDSSSGRILS